MNANYRGMNQYPEEYSGYAQGGNNMQAVGFHQGSYDSASANMGMMATMGGSGGGSSSYSMPGYDSSQSHMMMGGQGQQMVMYQQQQQQQAAAYMAQQQYYSGSSSGGSSGGQYGGQSYAVQGGSTAGSMTAMGGGASPYYNTGGQGQGGGGGGGRMVPPPHHHLRNTSGQQNPQQVADNILQMASSFPSHHTVQVPLKNRHAPYQIPRSPQNYYPEKCGGQQQGMGSQGPQQAMLSAQTQQQAMLSAQTQQQAMLSAQTQQQAMHSGQGSQGAMHSAQSLMAQPGAQMQPKVSQPPNMCQSPAMMYAGSSPHSHLQHSSPSSPLMMQSPQAAQAHQSMSSPGALSSPSSAAVCSPVPSSPGLASMRSPGSMPMRSPAHLSSSYSSQPISSPPHRPFPATDSSAGAQHCSPTSMHSPASHSSSPYASGMAQLVNSPPQQSQSYSALSQSSCKMSMLMDSGQGPGGQRGQCMQGQSCDPLQSLQKLVMLPETQVVDPKSVVNDGCLQNCEDGSKNCEGPAEQSGEAEGCSAGVSVNCSPPTADTDSTSTSPSQEVSAESASVSQEMISQYDCSSNSGDSTEAPSVTENPPISTNEKASETSVSSSPTKLQVCSSSDSNSSDQTVCSTSQKLLVCRSHTVSETANTAKPQSNSFQSVAVVPATQCDKPQIDVAVILKNDGCSTNGLKKQNVASPTVCNGPATQVESSDKMVSKQHPDKSNIPGASVQSDSQQVVFTVASDSVRETEKEVQYNMLKEGNSTNPGEAASPPKKRHSQRLLTLASKSYKSLNEGSLVSFDSDNRLGLEKKGVQSSTPGKPSLPKKHHNRRQSQSSASKSTSEKVSAVKSPDLRNKEGSNSVIAEDVLYKSPTAGKQKLVNGFDDKRISPPGDAERTVPKNHIHKRQTNSEVKGLATKDKAVSPVQSNGSKSADMVNGPKDLGQLTPSKTTECDNSIALTAQGSMYGSDSTSLPADNVLQRVPSNHSLTWGEDDSFSSELDFGYDSPPFEMQDDGWKPEPEKLCAASGEDEADGNGDIVMNDLVQKANLSSKGVEQSSPSKAPLMVTRSVTRSITGHVPPKRKAEDTEYVTNYKRTRRSLAISGQQNSLLLSMECDEIDTKDKKDSSSDVEVISSDDESLSVQNTQCKNSLSVYIPDSNDKNNRTPVLARNRSPKRKDLKMVAKKNQNKPGKSKSRKLTLKFYSVRGAGGRFISRREASISPGLVTSPVRTDLSSQLFLVAEQQTSEDKEADKSAVPVRETRRLRNRSEQPSVMEVPCGITGTMNKPNHANIDAAVILPNSSPHDAFWVSNASPQHKPNTLSKLPSEQQACLADKKAASQAGVSKLYQCLTDIKDTGESKLLECLTGKGNGAKRTEDKKPHEDLPDQKSAIKKDKGFCPDGCLLGKMNISKHSEDRPGLELISGRKGALKTGEVRKCQDLSSNRENAKKESRLAQDLPDRTGAMDMEVDEVEPPHKHLPDDKTASENSDMRPLCLVEREEKATPVCLPDKKSASGKEEIRSVTKPKKPKKRKGNQKKNWFSGIETVDDSFKSMKFSKTLDHLQNNKKDKSQSGKVFSPFVQVQGKRSTPTGVSVFNAPPVEGKNSKFLSKKGATCAAAVAATTTMQIFSSDKSVMVPWTKTTNAPWVCGLCGMRSSYRFLGDLFGPYFLESQISALQKGTGEGGKKDSRHDSAAGQAEVQNPHNTRRKSVTHHRSLSTEETSTMPAPQEVWVHEDCVLWSTGICLVGTRIHGLEEALSASTATVCAGCQQKGALIGCLHKGCNQNFHYICAVDKMCFLDVENFSMLCPKHKDKRLKCATASISKS